MPWQSGMPGLQGLGISALMPPPEFFLGAEISLAPVLHSSAGCRSCPGFQTVLGAVCRHGKPAVCLLEAAAACSKMQKKKNKKQSNQTSVSVCWVLHKGRGGCSVKYSGPAHHRSKRLTKLLGCGPCRNNYSEFPLLKGEAGLF